jgi:hypothetical protein
VPDVVPAWREIGSVPCREADDLLRLLVGEIHGSAKWLSQEALKVR